MASREAMIELIHRAYEARAQGDIEGVMAAFHPKGVFELKGDKGMLEIAGATEGHSNIRTAMTGFIGHFEFLQRDIVDTVVEGDRAVVHSRLTIRFVPKDTVIVTEVLDTFRFEDGKIIELVEFADTALVRDLMSK